MRVIAVFLVLLVTTTGVAAQDAAAPTTHPVNWLCDNAFVQAELEAGLLPGPVEPGDDGSDTPAMDAHTTQSPVQQAQATQSSVPQDPAAQAPGTADPASTDPAMQAPAADPVNATTSSVDRDPGFLDAAIRACSSVEDFVAGAALHPLLLGDLEPIALLQERCPEADLADYSTCVSLIHALATPAPTARPTATPPATPRPRATSKPKATPTATPRPQTGSATGTRADGKVRVPAIRATVRGATRVVYFDIRGRTWDQLNRSTAKHTARLCRDHQARACLETRISNVRPRVRQDRQTGACTLTGLSADLTMVAYMPRWSAPKRVSPALAWVWRKSIARTGWHEAQHAKIAARHFARLSKLVAGKPCSKFAAVTRKWWKRLTRAQHRFDEVDYRRSAAVHARWWQRAYARFR